MTGTQLVYGALRLLGVLRPGMTANAASGSDGLSELNDLIDNWNTDRLKIFDVAALTFALISGKQTYTMGTGGDFNAARPVKIETANLITTATGQTIRTPMNLLTKEQWAAITVEAVPSPIPYSLYDDGAYPLANLSLFPYPSDSSAQIELYCWQQLTSFASLVTNVNFPPGYALALRYNLAVQMAPSFAITAKSQPSLPLIIDLAKQYRRDIELLNSPTPRMRNDVMPHQARGGVYDWIANR